jgi:hypothetical protein
VHFRPIVLQANSLRSRVCIRPFITIIAYNTGHDVDRDGLLLKFKSNRFAYATDAMNKGFLAIGTLTFLLGFVSVIFTVGYFLFGWDGQYRYEMFYFPSPVTFTLDSLTATGRMISFVLPIVAFATLLLTADAVRIPSARMLSAGHHHQQRDSLRVPKMKQYPTGILAVSVGRDQDLVGAGPALQTAAKPDFLARLFPYDSRASPARLSQIDTGTFTESERSQSAYASRRPAVSLLTKT